MSRPLTWLERQYLDALAEKRRSLFATFCFAFSSILAFTDAVICWITVTNRMWLALVIAALVANGLFLPIIVMLAKGYRRSIHHDGTVAMLEGKFSAEFSVDGAERYFIGGVGVHVPSHWVAGLLEHLESKGPSRVSSGTRGAKAPFC